MELVITGAQVFLQIVIVHPMVNFTSNFFMLFLTTYALAMSSTALAVMLGCAVEDPKLGQEMLPLLFVPQMLFSGFFVIPELIPVWLRWARYLCSLTYALRIATVEEFDDPGCAYCQTFLKLIDADPDEVWWNWLVLVALFIVFRIAGLIILKRKATKFY
jgi:ABC-type multidrug transport system permease subunit